MAKPILPTEFAPAQKSSWQEIRRQTKFFASLAGLQQFANLFPDMALVFNRNRQVVFANDAALKWFRRNEPGSVYGLRLGELLDCVHASETQGGCGTTKFCRVCGGTRAILSGLRGREATEECQITEKGSGDALNLRVWNFPLRFNNEPFTFHVVRDISHEKRRYMLERIFLHDVMNTVTGICGWVQILKEPHVNELDEVKDTLFRLSQRLVEELRAQRELLAAENNELVVNFVQVDSLEVLNEVVALYQKHEAAQEKQIVIDAGAPSVTFTTDRVLLSHVLGNMVKNALEASQSGATITLGCDAGGEIRFWVHNPGSIPPEVQLQIFQRFFSTKETGRGLGTYSMRLLSERYLKGSVGFTTSEKDGTRFVVRYPLQTPRS